VPGSGSVLLILAAAVLLAAAVRMVAGFRRFREATRTALEATPDIRVVASTPTGLSTTVSGYPLTAALLRLYLARSRPGPEVVANALRRAVPPASMPPLGLVRDRILPMLKRGSTLPPATGYAPENRVLRTPFDGDVVIAYVIEGQFRVTYVTKGMLDAWGLAPDALHELALANLRAKTQHLLAEIGGPRGDYVALDGFDAARLLVADLLIPPGLTDPLLAIPHEHALLVRSGAAAGPLAEETSRALSHSSLPLTSRAYRWTSGGPVRAER
jgi:hypothetical protein